MITSPQLHQTPQQKKKLQLPIRQEPETPWPRLGLFEPRVRILEETNHRNNASKFASGCSQGSKNMPLSGFWNASVYYSPLSPVDT